MKQIVFFTQTLDSSNQNRTELNAIFYHLFQKLRKTTHAKSEEAGQTERKLTLFSSKMLKFVVVVYLHA